MRKLYAVVSATGEVLGGAPFDGETLKEAEAEVRATMTLGPGDRVVPLTKKLKEMYPSEEE
jgi:hypothetical protein